MPFFPAKKPQIVIGSPAVPIVHETVPTVFTTSTPAEKTIYSSTYSYSNAPVVTSPKILAPRNEYKYNTATSSVTTTSTYPTKASEFRTFTPSNGYFYETVVPVQSITNNIYEVTPAAEEFNKITYHPRVEVYSTASFVIIMMDIPGVSKENLNVELEKGLLKIYGKKEKPDIEELKTENEFHTKIMERLSEYYFCKVFQMPPAFSKGQSISCKLKDGELIIKILASELKESKQVIHIES